MVAHSLVVHYASGSVGGANRGSASIVDRAITTAEKEPPRNVGLSSSSNLLGTVFQRPSRGDQVDVCLASVLLKKMQKIGPAE